MNQTEIAAMSSSDLKRYIMHHPEDQDAFQAYLERRRETASDRVIIEADDPDWDEKFLSSIQRQLQRSQANR
jgi:hypothetical protein